MTQSFTSIIPQNAKGNKKLEEIIAQNLIIQHGYL